DAAELAHLVAERAKGAPCFLLGHSFGGLVSIASVLRAKGNWRGVLLSGAYLGLAMEVPPAKVFAARIASRVLPSLAMPNGLNGAMVTHDPVRAKAYDEDPLAFHVATARWFDETTKAQDRVIEEAPTFTLPLYMLYGAADPIAKVDRGRAFFD